MTTTLYKPHGLPVFPLHQDPGSDCLLARLLASDPWRAALPWPQGFEGGILHRLDLSTSGAVWVADHPDEVEALRALFAERRLVKRYLLLTAKGVPWDKNRCQFALAHDRRHKGRMVVQRGPDTPHRGEWIPADTAFERVRGRLFRATMRSGVMHQIRAHAAFLGIPLLGDSRYGGGATPRGAPAGLVFYLHHEGLTGPKGVATAPVPLPDWAS
ncbi:MAG: RNA pseudouridine synthase [Deltaproteobacteria bacterium]|nr:RNA pseudouridine synthase [Deltaproteobacteria bacterium]